ncbi:MAG TPA: GNAT family N-acetyltransferase [Pyrinomonadaceae bacterium]
MAQDEWQQWRRGDYEISTDPKRLDLAFIHQFLSTKSYWAQGRPLELVRRSIEYSLPFGLYRGARQVGFARVVTDYTTFAWLADVFVDEGERGQGLGVWLVEVALSHPQLQGLRRWTLATRDAHEIYRRFGFAEIEPGFFMEKLDRQTTTQTETSTDGSQTGDAET